MGRAVSMAGGYGSGDDDDDDGNGDGDDKAGGDTPAAAAARAELQQYAEALGFHPAHVAEGLRVAPTREALLDWLCLLVPEADLPERFRPAPAPLAAFKFDPASLALHCKATRLAAYGFAYTECRDMLATYDGNEVVALQVGGGPWGAGERSQQYWLTHPRGPLRGARGTGAARRAGRAARGPRVPHGCYCGHGRRRRRR